MKKLLPLIAFSIFVVVAVGSQEAFAGIAPIVEFFENISSSVGFTTIEYDLRNNSDIPFLQPPGPFSIFGFAVEVDGSGFDDVSQAYHDLLPGRADWCRGTDCSGAPQAPLILASDWNAGIELTNQFGGLSTNDVGTFGQLFTTHQQVALFYNFDLNNMIGPGEFNANGDFTVTGPQLIPSSDMVFLCIDNNNQIIICETGEILTQPEPIVGGEVISLQSTTLLVSGAQMTASWLAPIIISAIGIGLVLVRRK